MSKQKLTIWVDRTTEKVVRDLAAIHNLSVSQVAAQYLKQALQEKADQVGGELVVPAVEAAVHREVASMSDRLARLLARTAIEAATSRRISYNCLLKQGVTGQEARAINDEAWQRSVAALKKPLQGLDDIIARADSG